MNKPHLAYTVAKPTDGYVELIYSSVDVKIGHVWYHPSDSVLPKSEPTKHFSGEWNGLDVVYMDIRHFPGRWVCPGIDSFGEYTCNGNRIPIVENIIANSQRVGFHSHK